MPFQCQVGAVVCGWDDRFSYRTLCLASAYLQVPPRRGLRAGFLVQLRSDEAPRDETPF